MNANTASCQLALYINHCEFESSVNAANNIVFFPWGAGILPAFSRSASFLSFATPGRRGCRALSVDLSSSALSGAVTSETLASLKTLRRRERCAC